ncbi:MAG: DegQ family serine endoprotease [Gammaproteobacteria bacterium]
MTNRNALNNIGKGMVSLFSIALAQTLFAQANLPLQADTMPLPSLAPIIEKISPAIVNISVSGSVSVANPLAQDPFFRRFFPPESNRRDFQSAGSGVIVDAEAGYILTNHHVIENADDITVIMEDDRSLPARVVGSDAGSDIAVLQVDQGNLTEIVWADSDDVRVGDYVLAIGNPFRLEHTVTSGIVSGLGRRGINPEGYEDFIQTDAAINPGNSGGALVNLRGELVGINSAIFSSSGGNIGIGFAIPANMARSVMDQIVAFGTVRRGLLGVTIVSVTAELAEDYDLDEPSGALVTSVAPSSAADKAGLEIGDVIVSIDGENVTNASSLRNAVGLHRPSDKIRVDFIREGRGRSVDATLGEQMGEAAAPTRLAEIDPVFDGAEFAPNDETQTNFNGVVGVLVTQIQSGSPSAQRGLRTNDVITHVNRQRVRNPTDIQEIVNNSRSIILRVQRGGQGVLIVMR